VPFRTPSHHIFRFDPAILLTCKVLLIQVGPRRQYKELGVLLAQLVEERVEGGDHVLLGLEGDERALGEALFQIQVAIEPAGQLVPQDLYMAQTDIMLTCCIRNVTEKWENFWNLAVKTSGPQTEME
jgi:hypothetical protein